MFRVFISSDQVLGNTINIIDKDNLHHLKDVSRAKITELITACDENGVEYLSEIAQITPKNIILNVKEKILPKIDSMRLTIACAMPKNAKFDDIVDKLAQLGVYKIIPLETNRTIVKLRKDKAKQRIERWRKIALSASVQSQRNDILQVESVKTFDELMKESVDFDLKLIPALIGNRTTLNEICKNSVSNILVLIGPEGDFTSEELQMAQDNGFAPVSLGNLVLRVDTAAIAVSSFIRLNENN